MPVTWRDYDAFDWANAKQAPMDAAQRGLIEDLADDVLNLSPEARQQVWGEASPPGRFAATVLHVLPNIGHRFTEQAASAGVAEVGVKIFKTTGDAQREAERLRPFHREQLQRLPGLPNAHVQRSLTAEIARDRNKEKRILVVQEWVAGDSLEDLLRQRWPAEPIDGRRARGLIEQLFGGIIVPLWSAGTVWWDVRDANYCVTPAGRLQLIDVDSLAAYADEILDTPDDWERRTKGKDTALARLRQMTIRLVLAQGLKGKARIEKAVRDAWQSELEPALRALGQTPNSGEEGGAALARFIERLRSSGLLTPDS